MFSSGAIGYALRARIALLIASYDFVFETENAHAGARALPWREAGVDSRMVQQMVLPRRSDVSKPLTKSG